MSMNEYEKFLEQKLKDGNTFVLTAENLLAIRNLKKTDVLDVGISEQSLIGIASGIAKMGGKCYVHALSNFLLSRAYEFLKIDLDYNKCHCVLVGSIGGIQSTFNGPTHQSIDELSILENFNSFEILFPITIDEMVNILKNFKFKKSLYIRYTPETNKKINLKKKKITNNFLIGDGDTLIISYGIVCSKIFQLMLNNKHLQKKFKLFNFSYLKKKKITHEFKKIKKFKKILVIEDHLEFGSIHSRLKSMISKNNENISIQSINFGENYFKTEEEIPTIMKNMGISEKKLLDIKI